MLSIETHIFVLDVIIARSKLPYIGCDVADEIVESYLSDFENETRRNFTSMRLNQSERDQNEFHITIISPFEYRRLSKFFQSKVNRLMGKKLEFEFFGLGRTRKNSDVTYYVVLECEDAQEIRKSVGLNRRDFHITLGFDEKDVHNVDKSKNTLVSISRAS